MTSYNKDEKTHTVDSLTIMTQQKSVDTTGSSVRKSAHAGRGASHHVIMHQPIFLQDNCSEEHSVAKSRMDTAALSHELLSHVDAQVALLAHELRSMQTQLSNLQEAFDELSCRFEVRECSTAPVPPTSCKWSQMPQRATAFYAKHDSTHDNAQAEGAFNHASSVGYGASDNEGANAQAARDASAPRPQRGYSTEAIRTQDHVAAGLLGIFLGAFGLHKFYLGYTNAGFVMLAITIIGGVLTFGLASLVMAVVGIIEGIVYLCTNQKDFEKTYVYQVRPWF